MPPQPSRRDRGRFHAALALFALWIVALGAMAAATAFRPGTGPTEADSRPEAPEAADTP